MNITYINYGLHHGSRWSRIMRQFAEWRRRSVSRHELQYLSDQTLRDIGLTSCEVHREASKTFWMT